MILNATVYSVKGLWEVIYFEHYNLFYNHLGFAFASTKTFEGTECPNKVI